MWKAVEIRQFKDNFFGIFLESAGKTVRYHNKILTWSRLKAGISGT